MQANQGAALFFADQSKIPANNEDFNIEQKIRAGIFVQDLIRLYLERSVKFCYLHLTSQH